MTLIDELVKEGWLRTPRIIEAFREIKRVDFLPADMKRLAELNEALPIGYGQTISQPLTVAFMLELLQPEPGNKILDIGFGSGWTTALLAQIVSQELKAKIKSPNSKMKGRVISIEIIPELKNFGENNIAKYNFIEKGIVECVLADGSKGYSKEAPYDRILASASVQGEIPLAWREQLKIGGRLVAPVGSSVWLLIKSAENQFEEQEYPGFAFVPLVKSS